MPELPLAIIYSILAYGPMVICDSMARNDPSRSTGGGGGYGASSSKERNAFFALRSCHQILRGDTGEFFSPDYLCSNPPLWCNWTIQVPAGKRVHMVLEDFTPADACHLKTDQIHVDEAPSTGAGTGAGSGTGLASGLGSDDGLSPGGDHRILEKCWRKAEYVSLSETVHVVLLISRTPNAPLRGFYGTFKAIGGVPSSGTGTVEAPGNEDLDKEQEAAEKLGPPNDPHDRNHQHHVSENENELPVATPRSKAKPSTSSSGKVDHQSAAPSNELISEQGREESQGQGQGHGAEKGKVKWENVRGPSEGTVPGGGGQGGGGVEGGRERGEGGESKSGDTSSSTKPGNKKKKGQRLHGDDPSSVTPAKDTDSRSKPTKGRIGRLEDDEEYVFVTRSPESLVSLTMTTVRRDVVEDNHDSPSVPTPKVQAARRPGTDNNIRERAAPHLTPMNGSHHLHLPGASLFEVSLEVSFNHQPGENWDELVSSLLAPAKAMVKEQLVRYAPKAVSSKRIKRLSSGALFLLWIHFGEGQDSPQTRGGFHATVEGLKGRGLLPQGEGTEGVISYVTVSDVNECGTHLSQCDVHAECVNRFGSYACRCRHGYLDMSRSGPGGTVCIDPSSTGCSLSPPALLKGVYCVCFLLGLLLFSVLLALVAMWRRRHQGAFTLHCQGSCPSHGSGLTGVATPPAGCCNHRFCCCEGSGRRGGCMNAEKPLPPPPPPPPMGRCAKDGGCGKGKGNDPPLLHYGPLTVTEGESTGEEGWGVSDTRADHCTV
ncbi:uncharacterized protein zgc:66455 [Engraulis encrasicolus]|uniref:uncharacterized protein zgc:66455 n=1 Tax=Engraulis encrasicolus TaxID=184585 RepID=UPI002FCF50B7